MGVLFFVSRLSANIVFAAFALGMTFNGERRRVFFPLYFTHMEKYNGAFFWSTPNINLNLFSYFNRFFHVIFQWFHYDISTPFVQIQRLKVNDKRKQIELTNSWMFIFSLLFNTTKKSIPLYWKVYEQWACI